MAAIQEQPDIIRQNIQPSPGPLECDPDSSVAVIGSANKKPMLEKVSTSTNNHHDMTEMEARVAEAEAGGEFRPGARFYMVFVALGVLTMMVALDGTSLSIALPIMAKDLNGGAIEDFWTGTSYLLTSAVFQLPIVALSHIFGRMPLTLFSAITFFAGILIAGLAKNFRVMLVGRTIQGIGGGGIFSLTDVIVTDLVPLRQRGAYLGLISAVWALGSVVGPVIGGAFAQNVTWRWVFWINFPFVAIAVVVVPLSMRLTATPGSMMQKIKRVDWFGNLLLIISSTVLLMGLTWGGVQFPWNSAATLVPLLGGAAALFGLVFYEMYVPIEPTIRTSLFTSYNMNYSLVAAMIHTLIVYAFLYFMPLYFEAAKGYGPIVSGVALFPQTFTVAPMSIVSGIIITKTGSFRPVIWFGWVCITLGCGLMVMLDVDTTVPQWIFINIVSGIGLGFIYSSLNIVNQVACDDENMAFAVGMFIFFRTAGQALGVAICGVIFQNQMAKRLSNIPALASNAEQYARDAASLVQTIRSMPGGSTKTALKDAYADALKTAWIVMCALSAACLVGSFFINHVSLDRELKTDQGLQDSKKDEDNPA